MPVRLAVDFGTSNTVRCPVGRNPPRRCAACTIPEFGHIQQQGDETISLIPSLINYAEENTTWIGNQVIQRAAGASRPRTFSLDETLHQPQQPAQSAHR